MSEQAFRERIAREQSELAPMEAVLKRQETDVVETKAALDAQHKRVREAHDGLREYLDAHPPTKGDGG